MTTESLDVSSLARRGNPALAWLRARWAYQQGAWFGPADPRVLAIARVLVFWYIWPGLRIEDYSNYADFKSAAWYPVSFFKSGLVPLLDAPGLHVLCVIAMIASACALVGFLYPLSAPVTALVTLYLRGVPQNFGKVNHSENLFIFVLFIFAFARAADAWSLDALLARRLRKAPYPRPASGDYRWPLRFVTLLLVTMYAAAGACKLINSGWEWALSDSFRRLLLRHHFTHHPPTHIGVWIADNPRLCKALAFMALCTELSAPLALLGRSLAAVILPGLFLLQVSIWLLLGVKFSPMLPLFLCLLPWNAVLIALDRAKAWLGAFLAARRTPMAWR